MAVPSVTNVLATPLKSIKPAPSEMRQIHSLPQKRPLILPECLHSVPMRDLGPCPRRPTGLFSALSLVSASSGMLSLSTHTHNTRRLRFHAHFAAVATTPHRTIFTTSGLSRSARLSSIPLLFRNNTRSGIVQQIPKHQQQRFIFGLSRHNHSLLAHLEKTANNNPNSANSQNAFYTALLRANMPGIVVERYQTGRYVANAATESLYTTALRAVGGAEAAIQGQAPGSITPEQAQAVGQAVAARSRGGKVALSTRKSGTGHKETPLYVVVEESLTSSIFRWIRFFLMFGFIGYFCLLVLNVIVDTTGILKNVRGQQSNEAQPQQQKVRFSDVHGCDEAKDELQEVVEFLTNPERFSSLGGKLPKGVLLVGPPGTGKTLLARAVAGEAGVPFFYMSGSEFDEVYVGVGAKRVRELFTQARGKAPAIIFIDELDAIGAKRNERDAAYVKQTLNQLLTELDGFSQTSGVIVLAATNYPQLLDKALTRPGRFDRKVEVGLPDVRGRVDILNHHMKDVLISSDVDPAIVARGTPGFSGADLENLVNQAAVHASRFRKPRVGPADFDWAKDKIIMGAEARSRVMRDEDKLATAYHEAGHALVSYYSPAATPLYKITIVPRGISLGTTHFLPEMDVVSRNYSEYLAEIDVSMGGRVAEELVFGPEKVTSGISGVSLFINFLVFSSS